MKKGVCYKRKLFIVCVVFVVIQAMFFSSCASLNFTAYNTPEKAIESSYDETLEGSENCLIEEKIDVIEQNDVLIYIFKSHDTIEIAFLEKRNDGYVMYEIKSYYEISDVKSVIEDTSSVSEKTKIYYELSLNSNKPTDEYYQKEYKINVFGKTSTYYFYYMSVSK